DAVMIALSASPESTSTPRPSGGTGRAARTFWTRGSGTRSFSSMWMMAQPPVGASVSPNHLRFGAGRLRCARSCSRPMPAGGTGNGDAVRVLVLVDPPAILEPGSVALATHGGGA